MVVLGAGSTAAWRARAAYVLSGVELAQTPPVPMNIRWQTPYLQKEFFTSRK